MACFRFPTGTEWVKNFVKLRKITAEQSEKEFYTSHGGLTLLGQAIELAQLKPRLAARGPYRRIRHGDILKTYLGLLGIGKSDFEAAEGGEHSPVRHRAKRRRVRTVMQELTDLAGKFYQRGRRLWLRFSRHCPAFAAFERVHARLAAASG